jgi:pimeloyl-ACP methyl ester carboxylesterase
VQLSTDHSHHFELLRMLGHCYHGASDIQEVLQVAEALLPGNDESWFKEWDALARRVREAGDKSFACGHRRSSAESYLRASMYFMASDFFLHGNVHDPRIVAAGRASRWCFMAASADLDYTVVRVEIPFEEHSLPAYVLKSKGANGHPAPTLLCHTGFDGTKEEIAVWPGMAAIQRGYTVIAFDGPGQGEMIREKGLTFRSDWENVVTPVVDYALTRSDVDPCRLALMGVSFGGLLAPLAAMKEFRLRALVANGGVVSFRDAIMSKIPSSAVADMDSLSAIIERMIANDSTARWAILHGQYVFGAKNFPELLEKVQPFQASDLSSVRCATLVIDADQEGFFAGQPQRMFDDLTCRKTYMKFLDAESAGAHCQAGAEGVGAHKIFDWLDEALAIGS